MPTDFRVMLAFTVPLALGIAALASAFGLGRAVSAAMEAIARQPEAAPQIQTAMIIGCALIEALTIYVLVTVFIFQGRIARPIIDLGQPLGGVRLQMLQFGFFLGDILQRGFDMPAPLIQNSQERPPREPAQQPQQDDEADRLRQDLLHVKR